MIVHWGMLWGRSDLADINKEWLETVALSDDELAQLDLRSREAYLRANNPRRRGAADRKGKACMVIMLVATMVALVWLFAASAMGASEGVSGLFWLPWVVGSLGSGIALIVIESREAYLRANNPRRRGAADRKGKACMVIMLVATMVALVWLFAASAMGASVGVSGLFWLPWVVGSLGSGIALIVIEDDDAEPHCEGKR